MRAMWPWAASSAHVVRVTASATIKAHPAISRCLVLYAVSVRMWGPFDERRHATLLAGAGFCDVSWLDCTGLRQIYVLVSPVIRVVAGITGTD